MLKPAPAAVPFTATTSGAAMRAKREVAAWRFVVISLSSDGSRSPCGRERLEVAARAEHLARAREQHRAHARILVAADRHLHQLAREREIDRVGGVGPVRA